METREEAGGEVEVVEEVEVGLKNEEVEMDRGGGGRVGGAKENHEGVVWLRAGRGGGITVWGSNPIANNCGKIAENCGKLGENRDVVSGPPEPSRRNGGILMHSMY